MLCTTQCDWASSSWLKGTITPAVIKGQKEHHQQLSKKIRSWVRDHSKEFRQIESVEAGKAEEVTTQSVQLETMTSSKSYIAHAQDISRNPVMMGIVGLLCLLLLYQRIATDPATVIIYEADGL